MLEGVQTEIRELGGFLVTEDAEDSTVIVEVIVENVEICRHLGYVCGTVSVRSSELAQTSRRDSSGLSMTARPLYWMRNPSARMTCPMDCAATLYCRAVSRRRASKVGLIETMARAPRSLKRAYSAQAAE